MWSFNAPSASSFCDVPGLSWQSQLGVQGALNMRYARLLFESRNWHKLVPDQGHTAVTAGLGTKGGTDYVTAAYGSDGSSIIAYLPSSRTVTVNGGVLSGSTMKVWWYKPATGVATSVGTFPTSSPRTFTPAASGDWVLVVDDAARGFGAPGDLGALRPTERAPDGELHTDVHGPELSRSRTRAPTVTATSRVARGRSVTAARLPRPTRRTATHRPARTR